MSKEITQPWGVDTPVAPIEQIRHTLHYINIDMGNYTVDVDESDQRCIKICRKCNNLNMHLAIYTSFHEETGKFMYRGCVIYDGKVVESDRFPNNSYLITSYLCKLFQAFNAVTRKLDGSHQFRW